ncbi:MAG: fatty acyl-AMP ligase [Leptolyngbyaceae cyanobacterium]
MPPLTFNRPQGVSSGLTWIDLLSERATQQPSRIAFQIWNDGTVSSAPLTYGELDCRSRAIAARMQRLNLKGERVLLLCPPGLDYIVAFCACLYAGAIAVPIYPPRPNQSLERFQGISDDAQSALILLASAQQFKPETLAGLPTFSLDAVKSEEAADWQPPGISPEEIAFLQYTSGSTSAPKGVQISHGNLIHNVAAISHKFGLSNQSEGVCWLPPYHDMGLIGGILTSLYQGATTTLMSPVDFLQRPVRWLQAISHTQATISGGPNFAYERCVEKIKPEQCAGLDLSRWSVAFTGAEPLRMATLERFANRFAEYGFRSEAFYPCYGMAESTLMITGGDHTRAPKQLTVDEENLAAHRIQSADQGRVLVGCGQVIESGELEIINPQTCRRCQPNEVGEIWVTSPSIAQGYWQQPQLTQDTFQAYLADTGTGPFLRTGDLGCVQEGELYVTGRLKEVMIINGRNHYASDVEATVAASHPAFGSMWGAAFTVDQNDQIQLVIVQEVGRVWLRKLEPEPVLRAIRQTVSRVHGLRVETIVLVKPGSLPKTSSGKIQRSRCCSQFLAEQLRPIPVPARQL